MIPRSSNCCFWITSHFGIDTGNHSENYNAIQHCFRRVYLRLSPAYSPKSSDQLHNNQLPIFALITESRRYSAFILKRSYHEINGFDVKSRRSTSAHRWQLSLLIANLAVCNSGVLTEQLCRSYRASLAICKLI